MKTIMISLDTSSEPHQYSCQFDGEEATKITNPSKDYVLTNFLAQNKDAIKEAGGFNVQDDTD